VLKILMKLIDVLLLPKKLFANLSDKKWTLYLGIFFVGAVDIYVYIYENYKVLFLDKSTAGLISVLAAALIMLVVVGVLDVFLFSYPIYDFCEFLKKKFSKDDSERDGIFPDSGNASVIKVMKVYIIAHIPILPLGLFSNYIYFKISPEELTPMIIMFLIIIYGIIQIWFNGIIAYGVSTMYNARFDFSIVLFLTIFVWSYLEGIAIEYIINNWLLKLILQFSGV